MGLFGGYQNPGAGINPYAPKKNTFARFWELLWHNLGKLLTLNLLYALMHLPLLLSYMFFIGTNNKLTNLMCILLLIVQLLVEGPTMSGCAKVLRKIILDKPVSTFEEFKAGFQDNFGPSLLYFLIDVLGIAMLYCNRTLCPQYVVKYSTKLMYAPLIVTISVDLVLLFMNFYIFPMQTATHLNKRSILKNALQLTVLSPKQCLLTLFCVALEIAVIAIPVLIWRWLTVFLCFYPAAMIGFTVMYICYPVIQKYVINPYYEQSGEPNPELNDTISEEERVFTDRSDSESPAPKEKTKQHRTIS